MSTFTSFILIMSLLFLQTDGEREQFPNIPPLPTTNLQSLTVRDLSCQSPIREVCDISTKMSRVGLSSNKGTYCSRSTEGSSPVAVCRADSEQLLQSHSRFPGSQDEEQELGNGRLNSHISEILPPQLKRQDPKKPNKITKGDVLTHTFVI